MGSKIFDFLHSSVLFDAKSLQSNFQKFADSQLRDEVARYREFVDANLDDLRAEISSTSGGFKLLADGGHVNVDLLKQCAWYAHQFVVHDPLYELSATRPALQRPMEQLVGLKPSDAFDRARLIERIRMMQSLTPMVATDYVKFLPISRLFEPPKQIPLTYSATGFSDALPPALLDWVKRHAQIDEVKVLDGKYMGFRPKGQLRPVRHIGLQFERSDAHAPMIFTLTENEIRKLDPQTGEFEMFSTVPDTPPARRNFDVWVDQSMNSAAYHTVRRILLENMIAIECGATYLTASDFTAGVMQHGGGIDRDVQRHAIQALLALDVPFAADADITTLMELRRDEGEAFELFRVELERQFRAIQLESDPARAQTMARHAAHEIEAVGVAAVANKVRALKARGRIESAIGIAGLVGSVLSGGWSLLATAGAALAGAKTAHEYWSGRSEHPAFFMWRVKDASAKRVGVLRGLR